MTRRVEALHVTLEEPMRIDDVQDVIQAIEQLETVAGADPLDVDRTALATLKHRMEQRVHVKVDEAFREHPEGFEE